ncbi:MAG: penicillin acylase family protein [Bacteroidota bacterium]
MRKVLAILFLAVTVFLCWFLDGIRVKSVPLAAGRILDPVHGFWQNMENEGLDLDENVSLAGLSSQVKVHYDERHVPHIFAENEADLHYMQGYVTARDRLWQMEFQVMAAAGRLSEVIDDERVVRLDRMRRRTGMVKAAENALKALEEIERSKTILDRYTAGVNAYIDDLCYTTLPLEYKLLDYRPEHWSNLKTCLLLKLMAWDLTGRSMDLENTNSLAMLDSATYDFLYPYQNDSTTPIIPRKTPWEFTPVSVDTPANYEPKGLITNLTYPKPHENNGSNNWAVSGAKTKNGYPILCNDPHLGLRLPSIWYEIQLTTPDNSVYGVSLPGSPLVIIGFNEHVAWGVTNASRDVLDWYNIDFTDSKREAYTFDGGTAKTEMRVEEIKRRGKPALMDTVVYTQHGPVVFDRNFQDDRDRAPVNVAMRWAGIDPSNEILTFYGMNHAKSYADYRQALTHFACPGQNFVFAAKDGDIAITQQGRFPAKWPGQGLHIMDGANPLHLWQKFIPADQNPTVRNPAQGFVFSANQAPVGPAYPYRTDGLYDDTRNRRIAQVLAQPKKFSIEDMQKLQNDNYNQLASESVPQLLAMLKEADLSPGAKEAVKTLRDWNYMHDKDLKAPVLAELWGWQLVDGVWSDDLPESAHLMREPNMYRTVSLLADSADFAYCANKSEVVTAALNAAVDELEAWKTDNPGVEPTWHNFNDVHVLHLTRQKPFSHYRVPIGGNGGIVNANRKNWGASWRMIVELGPETKAYGVIPGGESGNPGSPNFDHMIDDWAAGRYFPLHFLKADGASEAVVATQVFSAE